MDRQRSDILVVVLNWNGGQELLDCLISLGADRLASTATDVATDTGISTAAAAATETDTERITAAPAASHDILLVDNASSGGSFETACARFPGLQVLRNPRNDYWAGGNNRAIAWALEREVEWLVFCNNDVVVDRRWPQALRLIAPDPSIGVIGFHVIGEYRREPRERFEAACGRFRLEDLHWNDDTYISGCFLAVRRACFETLGLFDATYCMYAEEDDFLIRVRLAGWRTVRCNAPIWHGSELAARRVPLLTSYLAIRNSLRLRLKFGPRRLRSAIGFVLEVLRRMLNPFQPVDLVNSHLRRLKPSPNPLLNLWILASACGWNLLHLPATLRLGRQQRRQALAARAGRR
jgi:GT2 family glycosyltransferase